MTDKFKFDKSYFSNIKDDLVKLQNGDLHNEVTSEGFIKKVSNKPDNEYTKKIKYLQEKLDTILKMDLAKSEIGHNNTLKIPKMNKSRKRSNRTRKNRV
jgi:hypothetical protein